MEVKFWGVRGSVPKPPASEEIRTKIRAALERCPGGIQGSLDEFMDRLPPWVTTVVGGNTSCLEISDSTDRLIFDAGTGLAALGHQLIPAGLGELFEHFYARKEEPLLYEEPPCEAGCHLRLFMTHTHWDHIQGFPFFRPAYVPNFRIDIYGADRVHLEKVFNLQQSAPNLFPVPLSFLKAKMFFHNFPPEGLAAGNFFLDCLPLPHPGGTLAYRIRRGDKTVVFATDYEFSEMDGLHLEGRTRLAEFIAGADVFISDTQYTYLDHKTKEGWGHSNALSVVEMAAQAGVKSFFLFHHDPNYSDEKLYDILDKTRSYTSLLQNGTSMDIHLAAEGRVLKL